MSADKNESFESTNTSYQETSGFIDDESHLRLSYYREYDLSIDDSFTSAQSTSFETKTESVLDRSDVRKKIQEYVAQMPDLPHPSETVASIISSASRKMGMVQLNYNNKIEQGSKDQQMEFSPNRRSTLNCARLPKE